MTTNYLELDYRQAHFYQYSKTELDGFEKFTSSTGKVSYRKIYKQGVFGFLENIRIKDDFNGAQVLTLSLVDGDERNVIKVQLFDTKGNFDNRFAESLICLLPNLDKGVYYRVYPYSIDVEVGEKTYTNTGFSIKLSDEHSKTTKGEKVEPKFTKVKKGETPGDTNIPKLDFEKVLGKMKPTASSLDAIRKFLAEVLETESERLGYVAQETSNEETAPKPSAEATNKPAPAKATTSQVVVEEDDEDLPF